MARLQLDVGGMACPLCADRIANAIGLMKGVHEVNVNLAREEMRIEFEPGEVASAQLKRRLRDLGFIIRRWWQA
jgi:copper chaperone CopZ